MAICLLLSMEPPVTVTFNGTRDIQATYTFGGQEYTIVINLDTGKIS